MNYQLSIAHLPTHNPTPDNYSRSTNTENLSINNKAPKTLNYKNNNYNNTNKAPKPLNNNINNIDKCLFFHKDDDKTTYLLQYVDDILITDNNCAFRTHTINSIET